MFVSSHEVMRPRPLVVHVWTVEKGGGLRGWKGGGLSG